MKRSSFRFGKKTRVCRETGKEKRGRKKEKKRQLQPVRFDFTVEGSQPDA